MNNTDKNIFFLGCGKMGSVIAQNLTQKAGFTPNNLTVLKKSDQNQIAHFNYIKSTASLPKGYQADFVFIAIKPQVAAQVLEGFAKENIFHANTIFISILAGKKLAFFTPFFGEKAKIVRSMPNMPIQDAQGVFPYLGNKNVTPTDIENLQQIFAHFGEAFELEDENLFDFTTAIFGSGPAYIFYLQEIFAHIAIKAGIDADKAHRLVETLFLGTSLMSRNSKLNFTQLYQSVAAKGGTTQAALDVFQDNDTLKDLVTKAITAAADKSKELSN